MESDDNKSCCLYGLKYLTSVSSEHRSFVWLFIITFLYHAIYIYFTNIDLAPDEAHYWEWSRRLGLSYYSKGPAVAYIIAFFTGIFGDTPFGVRFGAVFLSQITMLSLYYLTFKLFENKLTAFLVVLVSQLSPLFAAGAVLMTTDVVYVTCWTLCLLAVYQIIKNVSGSYIQSIL